MAGKILLRGATIVRPGDDPAVLPGDDLYIDGPQLVAVGPYGQKFPAADADEAMDCQGLVALPGLINTHTHTPLTYLRGVAQDVGLGDFFGRLGAYGHLVRREHAYWAALLAAAEMIRAGVTTCLDMFEWMDEVGRAFADSGLRAGLACEFAGVWPARKVARQPGFNVGGLRLVLDDAYGRDRLAQAEAEIAAIRALGCDRLTPFLGPHALYSCSVELLAEAAALAQRLNVPVTIHVAEHPALESQIRRRYGSTVAVLEETGILDARCVGVHAIYFTPAERERLSARRFGVAHCPGSNLKLGEGLAPVPDYLAAGMPVGLGTDSVMSNDNLDILEECRLAALAHKGERRRADVLAGDQALQMATSLGAEALGLDRIIGRLRPGYRADLVLLDASGPHWAPQPVDAAAVLYAASLGDVRAVMVDGAWVLRDGVIQTFDEAEVLARARRTVNAPGH